MKAVIYARYSSDNQREESIEGQLRECTAYCKKNDITILRTYIDRALSAKTDNRPEFQRMVRDSAKGLFDVIIVWKLDRFARNRYDSAHYKAQLRKYGVKVLSATENISDGPEGIILESMLEGMAEYYSAELSEKVIRGHTENALKCKYNGGTPTFGYVIDSERHYQIDPRTAPVVLEIFTQYDKGATMKEIMVYLNKAGVTTVRGKKIDLNFVAAVLHNRKYIGEYSYRHIVTPGGIPAIVPQDLFDRVQQRTAKNKKAPARHKAEDDYLLTTKLFCGTCGAMMVGESGTSSTGTKYHYYRCVNTKKYKTCTAQHKSIKKLPIENAVINAVMAKVLDDNFVEYIADTVMELQTRESSALPALRKQLEETERGITNMLNAIQMGIINASTKQRLDELEEAKKDIEFQIIQEEMKHPLLSREDVTYWICRFRTLDVSRLEERRRLVDSFVNSVTVFDEYILITFNYKEGETRLDFSDIERSDLSSVGGGFLGAGKTTLINKIAQKFIEEKVPVGVITNDQGQLLIDTEFIKVRGLSVEEVCGGCFCCNFPKLLDNADKLLKEINPQYIIAEPVGSCTDLIATVATPMKRYHGDKFSVAPLIVLIDAPRLLNNAFDRSTLGGYLRSHQAEEAEYLILTKIDEIGSDDIKSLILKLKNINPDRKIIPYSAVTEEGLQEILEIITSEEETARKPVDIDYDKYAEAEAELGWYNGIYEFTAPEYDSYELSMNILKNLALKYTPSDIAHAKVAITNANSHTKISLIGNEFTIGGVKGSRFGRDESKLNFNARIVSEPEKLRQTIRETIESCFKEKCIQYKLQFDDCFSPGRPNPTYRILDE